MPDAQVCGAKKPSSTPNGKMLDIVISREKMAAGLFAALAAALMYFLTKLIAARWKFVALQRTKMPMPPYHAIWGHLGALRDAIQKFPHNCIMHVPFTAMAREFPGGMFYFDLWPFSSPLIVISTNEGAQQIQDAEGELRKPEDITVPIDTVSGGPSLITMYGNQWKKWRALFSPAFASGYILDMAPVMVEEMNIFCCLLRNQADAGEMFQLEDLTLPLTLDIIGRLVLDKKLNCQLEENPLASALRTNIEWTTFGTILNPFKRYLSPRSIVKWYSSRQMDRYLHAEINQRLAEARSETKGAAPSRSIISLVLKTYLAENADRVDRDAVDDEFKKAAAAQVRIFLFAGHDTTSSTLLFCYHQLARHPPVLARLRAEHDDVFGRDFRMTGAAIAEDPSRLNQLRYTIAVIREVLRLHPPSSQMRRGRAGFDLVDLNGQRLPTEGCNLWVLTNAVHCNPRHWGDDPTAFVPERWLVGPDDPLYPGKGTWRPFVLGPRNCIGQTLALMELRVALAMTVREFDIQPAYDEWDVRHPRRGVKRVDGERAYASEKGGGGAHPSDGYPCRVDKRTA